MQTTVHGKKPSPSIGRFLLLIMFFLACSAGFTQGVTLSLKKAPLEKAFRQIETQVPQRFVYTTEMMERSHTVSIQVQNASLASVLNLLFKDQPLEYALDDQFIKVRFKTITAAPADNLIDVQGQVLGEEGEPLPGASVTARPGGQFTVTDMQGHFVLRRLAKSETLYFTMVGYTGKGVDLDGRSFLQVQLSVSVSQLDKALVIAYGTSTQRLSTGNISKVSAAEISRQPSSNPLSFLQGRVPGVIITQSNGVPGSSVQIQVRGRNSIAQGSDPLFVIDGVPYAPGNTFLNQISSALGVTSSIPSFSSGLSPFSLINPADIESIEVLKDADATAIYGSRGANGVVLISTKKGREGKTRVSVTLNTGWAKITHSMNMLNTPQYLQMRREAFANDNASLSTDPSNPGYAPDLLLWDTTRYSNFTKMLIGGTAHNKQLQASLSGGSSSTQFLLAGTYRYQSTVFPGNFSDRQGAAHFNLNHSSSDKKFHSLFTLNYTSDRNNLLSADLSAYLNMPPNLPSLLDSAGNLKWEEGGAAYPLGNPLSELQRTYIAQSENLMSNLQLNYRFKSGLGVKSNFGYNTVQVNEQALNPSTSFNPQLNTKATSFFANTFSRSWIVEPQADYLHSFGKQSITVLAGATFQEVTGRLNSVAGLDYANDLALQSVAAAGRVVASNSRSQYRYNAFFGRFSYNYNSKYLLNLSGRKDGSSRFGPGRQWAGFGAVGAAWIFTGENFFPKALSFLSYGKIRGSYGSSGNDQIGDYQYLDSWVSTPNPYQGIPGFAPARLFNPDYSWEVNRKLEAAMELGFFQDRLFLSASWFKNRSSNQLIAYPLPVQTGFTSVNKNLPALVQNTGLELALNYRTKYQNAFAWETGFNLSHQKNRLIAFPGLASSSYARTYVEGQPLSVLQGYHFIGVNPATGIYSFQDVDKDGNLSYPNDFLVLGNTDPAFYGGLTNTFRYKNFELSILLEFRKQTGRNYLNSLSLYIPGSMANQPALVLNRWQKPGDLRPVQQFTVNRGSQASQVITKLIQSNALYSDASYIRGKNLSLTYSLANGWLHKLTISEAKLYLQAVNFFTLTAYRGADPETQNLYALPPLKLLVAGININF